MYSQYFQQKKTDQNLILNEFIVHFPFVSPPSNLSYAVEKWQLMKLITVSKVLKLECLLSFRHVHTSGSIPIPPKVKDAVTLGGWVTEIKIQQLTEKSIIITISHDSNYSVSISNTLAHDPDILEYTFGSSLVLIIPSYPIPTHLIPFDPPPPPPPTHLCIA